MNALTKCLSGLLFVLSVCPVLHADTWPQGPVTLIVPWPPGDLEDILTHLIAEEISRETGQPAEVRNVPGDSGVTGAAEVASAAADGLVIGSLANHLLTTKVMGGDVPWNFRTFTPIGIFLDYPFVIAARADAPYNSLKELAEYSQSNPVVLGHFGKGISPTAMTFKAADDFGIRISADQAYDATDCALLQDKKADIINTTTQLILPCLQSGEVKLLVSFTSRRISLAPQTPTLEELTGIKLTIWNGLFVPRETPAMTKVAIARIARKALESDKVKELARETGAIIYWDDALRSKNRIADEIEESRSLLKYLSE